MKVKELGEKPNSFSLCSNVFKPSKKHCSHGLVKLSPTPALYASFFYYFISYWFFSSYFFFAFPIILDLVIRYDVFNSPNNYRFISAYDLKYMNLFGLLSSIYEIYIYLL